MRAVGVPVTDPALVAHGPFAVAAVDVQCGGRLVQTCNGAARAHFDHLVADIPQLEPLQQVDVGHVPVFLSGTHTHCVTHDFFSHGRWMNELICPVSINITWIKVKK